MTTVAKPVQKGSKKRKKKRHHGDGNGFSRLPNFSADLASRLPDASVFAKLAKYLNQRKSPRTLAKLTRSDGLSALLWCLDQRDTRALHERAVIRVKPGAPPSKKAPAKGWSTAHFKSGFSADKLQAWLDEARSPRQRTMMALESLAFGHQLPKLAQHASPELWHQLLRQLIHSCRSAISDKQLENPWVAQLQICELPITLAYVLPEIGECRDLLRPAVRRFEESLIDLCDGQGMVAAENLSWFPVLAACWTRCLSMTQCIGDALTKDARLEFEWVVRNLLRVLRHDGGIPFAPAGDAREGIQPMIDHAVALIDDDHDRALAKLKVHGKKGIPDRRLPDEPGFHSEWSGLAMLQPEWSPDEPRLTLDFSEGLMRAEWCTAGAIIFSGCWNPRMSVNGKELQSLDDEWETLCWFSDYDVDYFELEMRLAQGFVLQRQFLMARQDHFLYTADALVGPANSGSIAYELDLECSPGIQLRPQTDSHEGFIKGRRTLGLVLPLALSEWRNDRSPGSLQMHDRTLSLSQQSTAGQALYAPLFFDLHPRRMKKTVTWRQLTVAENLQTMRDIEAVAYRIQAGPEQWVAYRSLQPTGNRTFLGQNLTSEFLFARFLDDGDIEPLVEIE